jgi:NAD(P)-dependent dehydrogenase (short-subunit alcohol dehydrogenase family)
MTRIREFRMAIRFDGRVAIVTGAGNGLGRAHALGLASRGAKVVVNDFGGARDGTGGSLTPAETVVEEIRKAGGTAMADGADVSNFEQVTAMVERATREWGSVDRCAPMPASCATSRSPRWRSPISQRCSTSISPALFTAARLSGPVCASATMAASS